MDAFRRTWWNPRMDARRTAAVVVALCVAPTATVAAQEGPPRPASGPASRAAVSERARFDLGNGLEVFLRSEPRATACAVGLLFRIGEDSDPPDAFGLAHAAEHLWCAAATGIAPERTYEEIAASRPLGFNAQTAADATFVISVVRPAELLGELTDFAARCAALRIGVPVVEREAARLRAEIANMYGGLPVLAAPNRARASLRDALGFGPPGGALATFAALDAPRLADRLSRHYRAGNARLAVVGRFDLPTLEAEVRSRFGSLPRGEAPPPVARRSTSRPAASSNVGETTLERAAVGGGGGGDGYAALAVRPPPPDAPEYAAYFVGAFALLRAGSSVVPTPARPQFRFAPLDDASLCAVVAATVSGEPSDKAAQRLSTWLDEKLGRVDSTRVPAARSAVDGLLGLAYGGSRQVRGNPYGAALSALRYNEEAVARLRARLDALDDESLRAGLAVAFGEDRRASAVVRIR